MYWIEICCAAGFYVFGLVWFSVVAETSEQQMLVSRATSQCTDKGLVAVANHVSTCWQRFVF